MMQQLVLSNNINNLAAIEQYLDQFCRDNNIGEDISFDIHLIADELFTNVVSYAYEDDKIHDIIISIELNGKNIIMTITDDGKEFNPLMHNNYDLGANLLDKPIGGLGILLAKSKADDIEYSRTGNKNIIRIIKGI